MQNDHVLWIMYEERRRDLLVEASSSRLLSQGSFPRSSLIKALLSGMKRLIRIVTIPQKVIQNADVRLQ